jgi:cytoskeletal protein CcmA (bactofilin family)
MALFSDNKNNTQKTPSNSPTFISKEMEVTGNFQGKGAVQVEGILHGNISVDSVVIGEVGAVHGNITAKNVIINGKLIGSIHCDSLEVMHNGSVSNNTLVKNLKITGEIEGEIIVSELLEIESTGYIHGNITLNRLIIAEGGKIIGAMQQYKAKKSEKEPKNLPKEEISSS